MCFRSLERCYPCHFAIYRKTYRIYLERVLNMKRSMAAYVSSQQTNCGKVSFNHEEFTKSVSWIQASVEWTRKHLENSAKETIKPNRQCLGGPLPVMLILPSNNTPACILSKRTILTYTNFSKAREHGIYVTCKLSKFPQQCTFEEFLPFLLDRVLSITSVCFVDHSRWSAFAVLFCCEIQFCGKIRFRWKRNGSYRWLLSKNECG